jgi:hypothetical protein
VSRRVAGSRLAMKYLKPITGSKIYRTLLHEFKTVDFTGMRMLAYILIHLPKFSVGVWSVILEQHFPCVTACYFGEILTSLDPSFLLSSKYISFSTTHHSVTK